MKVLIMGCHGQVGTELMLLAQKYVVEAIGFDHEDLDITQQDAVNQTLADLGPDVVINAAAYTAVDKAEDNAEQAMAVNATAVGYLAQACEDLDIPLVHISTDYVFDGSAIDAYSEDDTVNPLGVYGQTKLSGENLVRELCSKHYILRTSWVFSAHGNNFVKTMLRLGSERDTLGVVADQMGKPTSAREIARVIYEILKSKKEAWGTYHIAQPEKTTWHGFALSIFEQAKAEGLKLKVSEVNAIAASDYPTPAKRPENSTLNCKKIEQTFGLKLADWQVSLRQVIKELHHG
ncbi:MAG: dTDP-4-dehydrorhamnose reductase [Ghiorsea sp.]